MYYQRLHLFFEPTKWRPYETLSLYLTLCLFALIFDFEQLMETAILLKKVREPDFMEKILVWGFGFKRAWNEFFQFLWKIDL